MALVLKDRVKETTTTTGTGTYTLAGAVAGFEAFSEIGNSNTTYYCCTDGTDFEVGIGTYTASGTTLARTAILQSSNSDAAVNWTSGSRTIFCTQPAEKAVFLDASGDLTLTGANYNIVFDKSDDALEFADNAKVTFGADGDLEIFHSGTASVIRDSGTGPLRVRANATHIQNVGATETMASFTQNGAVELYHDNAKKLETASGGISVTGEVAATSLDISGDVDVDGTLEADNMTLNGTAITTTATLSTGISNNNVPKFTSGVADNDFLRVDGTAIEGRSASEVLSDIAAMPLAGGTFTGDVTLTDTDAGSAEGPLLILNRDSGSPADNDILGNIKFKGDNDAGENVFYAGINAKINDATDGTEDGLLDLSVMANGTVGASRIRIQGNGDTVISNRDVRLNIGVDLRFEGATSNDHETTLTVTDPTADRTITLPDATGTVLLTDGSGASLTSLNASQLSSGTVPNARLDAQLQDVAGLAVTNGNFIVGDGSNFVAESGSTARTSLGLGTIATQAADSVNIDGGAIDGVTLGTNSAVTQLQVDNINIDGNSITSTDTNGNLAFQPNGTGDILLNADTVRIGDSNANAAITTNGTGDLTLNTNSGTNSGSIVIADGANGNISITPDGTGFVEIISTGDGAGEGPTFKLFRNSSSPADSDEIGEIEFVGKNDAAEDITYFRVFTSIADVSDGSEDARLEFKGLNAGSETTYLQLKFGQIDALRDLRLGTSRKILFEGATSNNNETTLTVTDPTADRTITLPDATGTVQLTDGSGASLTSLNASELSSGTVPNARLDAQLQDVAGLAVTNGGFIVGDGSNFVLETGSTARTSLGLGTAAVAATGISNGNVPVFTSGVADNDFLRVNGTSIEGRSASELASDIGASTTDEATALAIALG